MIKTPFNFHFAIKCNYLLYQNVQLYNSLHLVWKWLCSHLLFLHWNKFNENSSSIVVHKCCAIRHHWEFLSLGSGIPRTLDSQYLPKCWKVSPQAFSSWMHQGNSGTRLFIQICLHCCWCKQSKHQQEILWKNSTMSSICTKFLWPLWRLDGNQVPSRSRSYDSLEVKSSVLMKW